MTTNLTSFGVNVLDSFVKPVIAQKTLSVGPADRLSARIRFDQIEFYRINTSAALTSIQVAHFHIDVWGRIDDGINRQDNDSGTVTRIWQLITGLTEAANAGDIGWQNILAIKILQTSKVDYTKIKMPHRTLYCAATWN